MKNHLTDDQIEELLRALAFSRDEDFEEGQGAGSAIQNPAGLHLANCPSCRLKVKALQAATQRLALLKAPTATKAGEECPTQEVWHQIAAGIEDADAENCLNHAIHCEECGQLLAQAAADFSQDLTPQEEAQIAALSSSSPEWQMRLAARLRGGEADAQVERPARSPRFSAVMTFFTPSRMAFAATLIAAVVLGLQDYHLQERLADNSVQTSSEMHRLDSDGAQPKTGVAESISQKSAQPDQAAPAPALPLARTSEPDHMATLTLESGLTRGAGEMKRLTLSPGAEVVRITLHTPEAAGGVMHEELLTVDRRKVWSQELEPSEAESRASKLQLLVPAYLLTPDDYIIVLSREAANGVEEVASYSFRVPR